MLDIPLNWQQNLNYLPKGFLDRERMLIRKKKIESIIGNFTFEIADLKISFLFSVTIKTNLFSLDLQLWKC